MDNLKKSKKFQFQGIDWEIHWVDEIKRDDDGITYGNTDFAKRIVTLSTEAKGVPIPELAVNRTLWHELVHLILEEGQYGEASSDEAMVELLGKGIYELIKQDL